MRSEYSKTQWALTEFKKVSELSGKALDNYIDKLSELGNLTSRTTKNVWSSV